MARQHEFTAAFTSLTQQRREVLTHPERLESLGENPYEDHVELLPSPKKRSNNETTISPFAMANSPKLNFQEIARG